MNGNAPSHPHDWAPIPPEWLSIGEILKEAWTHVWQSRTEVGRYIFLPVVVLSILAGVITALDLLPKNLPEDPSSLSPDQAMALAGSLFLAELPLMIASFVLYALFAVAWPRHYLMPGVDETTWQALKWDARKTRFALAAIVVGVISLLAASLVSAVSSMVLGSIAVNPMVLALLSLVLACYVLARLSLVFPAAAVDTPMTFRDTFRLTRRVGFKMMGLVFVPSLMATLIAFVTAQFAVVLLYTVGLIGTASGALILGLIQQTVTFIGIAWAVTALSIAFERIAEYGESA